MDASAGFRGFREEVYKTTKNRMRIHNQKCVEGRLQINGVWWHVRDTRVSYVPVPFGPITIYKPGCERIVLSDTKVKWKNDDPGFFLDYDYEKNAVIPVAGQAISRR